jgi:Chaperone of endosialidase
MEYAMKRNCLSVIGVLVGAVLMPSLVWAQCPASQQCLPPPPPIPSFAVVQGNIGINTPSPTALLDVNGVAIVNELIIGESQNTYNGSIEITYNDKNNYGMYFADTNTGTPNAPVFQFTRGGSAVGSVSVTNTSTSYNVTSDRRLKENFSPTARGLDELTKISVTDFNFIADPKKSKIQGLIAQDLYKTYPEAVTVGGDDPVKKPWSIDYGRLTPLLIKSIQDLKSQNDEQEKAFLDLRHDFEDYKKSHP